MANLRGPIVLDEPFVVYKDESFKPQVTIRDGIKTEALPFGATIDLSAGTKKCVLRINKPDGSADVVRNTDVAAEGEKTDGANGIVTFFVADTVTTDWDLDVHDFEVEYQDTNPTVNDIRLVLVGKIEVLERPSDR